MILMLLDLGYKLGRASHQKTLQRAAGYPVPPEFTRCHLPLRASFGCVWASTFAFMLLTRIHIQTDRSNHDRGSKQ
jgi:hypothetical protein